MLWCSLPELDLCLGLIMVILYGLFSLRNKHIYLADVFFFSRTWPILLLCGYAVDASGISSLSLSSLDFFISAKEASNADISIAQVSGLDVLLCLLTVVILQSFKSFESVLLLMLAYVGQLFMLHSCDLVSFYVCLEAQNFCFLVLCGLQPDKASSGFSVEASLKYLLLSAFSSGVILFWFSALYLRTGMSSLFLKSASVEFGAQLESFQILLAMMFKLGAAPLHLWMVDIYGGVKRQLLMYISTAPKLSLFGFWVSSWHQVWTDFSVALFVAFSMILGSFGAYGQPALRALFAYSTVNEIGLMLMAIETAGFHSLFQHLGIYIITQLLLWNLSDKRLFSLIAVSLAGLPPLAGFFGKAYIFWHVSNQQLIFLLLIALFCTCLSLVYYLRVVRLFWSNPNSQTLRHVQYFSASQVKANLSSISSIGSNNVLTAGAHIGKFGNIGITSNSLFADQSTPLFDVRHQFTSACAIALVTLPLFFIKPFVL
mmetsp:Transcript_33330/g.73702  ORF Transcript_33330/g.73702 Transcript_33330/m.73702 type:complete len:486 (-) Transcript_33330:99-1556(-)